MAQAAIANFMNIFVVTLTFITYPIFVFYILLTKKERLWKFNWIRPTDTKEVKRDFFLEEDKR